MTDTEVQTIKISIFFSLLQDLANKLFLWHSKLQLKNHSGGDYYMLIKNSFEIDPMLMMSSRINVIIESKTTWKRSERARRERNKKLLEQLLLVICFDPCFVTTIKKLGINDFIPF